MSYLPRITTLPFAWSEGIDVLAAPAPLIIANTAAVPGAHKACIQPDIEVFDSPTWGGKGVNDKGNSFDLRDNIFLEAVRLDCPFADALLTLQARTEVRIYGVIGAVFDTVATGIPNDVPFKPNLFIDFCAPWGEWMEVNRFIPFGKHTGGDVATEKWIGLIPYGLDIKTLALDPDWNAEPLKLEISLKVRHTYPKI
ncbi:MAG: hypothetical protein WC906_04080 [Parcubacteria group bacterium]|jgi:hypothetical protein